MKSMRFKTARMHFTHEISGESVKKKKKRKKEKEIIRFFTTERERKREMKNGRGKEVASP